MTHSPTSDQADFAPADPEIELKVAAARRPSQLWIGGRAQAPLSGTYYSNRSPMDGSKIGEVASAGEEDVALAVAAAAEAQQHGWEDLPPAARRMALLRFADVIEDHADELAALDCLDVGKPFKIARAVDLNSAVRTFRWYAELCDKVYGAVAPTPGLDVIIREPMGVVAAIVPWNYPMMITAWKIAPMLAAGNSVILKPSENSPLSALRLAELSAEADLPPGVLNCLTGAGATGAALASHDGVRSIGFTGSTATGKKIASIASASTFKHVSLECGGKSAFIVLQDADVADAARKLASGLFYNAGQSCNAPTRLLVHRSRRDEMIAALKEEVSAYEPNNPLASQTQVGAIVNPTQLERIVGFVERAVAGGGSVVYGGTTQFASTGGTYFSPTLVTGVAATSELAQEEVFGPVLPIEEFADRDEALILANGTSYGLWANVCTASLDDALWFARRLKVGTIGINMAFGGDITTPLGGVKESGLGRDRGLDALYKYTETKHIAFPPT